MQDLKIENFKGFGNTGFELNLENKSLLLYGENGAGKTSLFEGLKWFYYYSRIYDNKIHKSVVGEERKAEENMLYNSFCNRRCGSAEGWSITVNGKEINRMSIYRNCPREYLCNYQMFLISYADLRPSSYISLDEILERVYFPVSIDVDNLWNDDFVESISQILRDYFYEDVRVDLHDKSKHTLRLSVNSITSSIDLSEMFNEALLHLILLVILLQIALLGYNNDKRNVLVLDDIITSLDVANRGLVARYIIETFGAFQKIILTHNVSYYNLFQYILHNCAKNKNERNLWLEKMMYLKDGTAFFSDKPIEKDEVQNLCREFKCKNVDLDMFGNKIRKQFESMIYLYFQGLQLGTREEVKDIIECVMSPKHKLYYKITANGKICDVYCLIEELVKIIQSNKNNLKDELLNKLSEYDVCEECEQVSEIVGGLKIYQKLIMHPLSHASSGLCNFTQKEIVIILGLLDKLSTILRSNKVINTTNIL